MVNVPNLFVPGIVHTDVLFVDDLAAVSARGVAAVLDLVRYLCLIVPSLNRE